MVKKFNLRSSVDDMNVLGIHSGHNSSATLLVNGEVKYAFAEERLTRQKMYMGFPYQSIELILEISKLEPSDIDYVAICGTDTPLGDYVSMISLLRRDRNKIDMGTKLFGCLISLIDNLFFTNIRNKVTQYNIYKVLKELGFNKNKVVFVDHHLAHVSSSYYCSGWKDEENILICSIDGKGDGLSHRTCIIENGELKNVYKTKDYDSIGIFYISATEYLGFIPLRHEGKITGLAAYGNKEDIIKIPSPITSDNSCFRNNLISPIERRSIHWIFLKLLFKNLYLFKRLLFFSTAVKAHYAKFLLSKFYKDTFSNYRKEEVAMFAQENLENETVKLLKYQIRSLKKSKICLAGGVCANVKLNQRIMSIPGVDNVYIQPAMGDDGLSLGAAFYLYSQKLAEKGLRLQPKFMQSVYLGTEYNDKQIERELKSCGIDYKYVEDIEALIAKLISQKKIVGRFNGRMEWGPRALGNRSILVDPRDSAINYSLNKRLKRTEFMPFAPSILEEYAKEYFIGYRPYHIASRFMTITYDVYLDKISKIPAVVHVDGTARPQVVIREDNPSYYKIIEEYMKITGLPVIINTSFNMHEEPILFSLKDAINSLSDGSVDILAIGNFLIENKKGEGNVYEN